MGFLPVAVGAIGTVAQMAGQAKAASAQRAAVREQQVAQQQSFQLTQQRFMASKNQAAQMYIREAMVAEQMRGDALNQFRMAESQQRLSNTYEQVNADIQDTNLRNQTMRLLGSAATVRGGAAVSNANQYEQLKAALGNDEQAANAFLQRALAMGLDPRSTQATDQASLLSSISNYQRTLESNNTTSRVANFQAEGMEAEAAQTEAYRALTKQFMDTQRRLNLDFQRTVGERMPTILDLQHQRNMVGLEAASKLRQAELSLGQQSNLVSNRAQQSALTAQINSMPSSLGAVMGGLTGLASQAIPFILSSRNPQTASIFGNQQQQVNQYPVYEFGQRLPQNPAQVIEFGQPLPRDNRLQDVSGRTYV